MVRQKKCNACGARMNRVFNYIERAFFSRPQQIYEVRCKSCGNLIYGTIKPASRLLVD